MNHETRILPHTVRAVWQAIVLGERLSGGYVYVTIDGMQRQLSLRPCEPSFSEAMDAALAFLETLGLIHSALPCDIVEEVRRVQAKAGPGVAVRLAIDPTELFLTAPHGLGLDDGQAHAVSPTHPVDADAAFAAYKVLASKVLADRSIVAYVHRAYGELTAVEARFLKFLEAAKMVRGDDDDDGALTAFLEAQEDMDKTQGCTH